MNTNLQNTSETLYPAIDPAMSGFGLETLLELLAGAGLAAEAVYDGDAKGCPHCLSQVLSEAA
jgi:hypothetical protein